MILFRTDGNLQATLACPVERRDQEISVAYTKAKLIQKVYGKIMVRMASPSLSGYKRALRMEKCYI
jgi:hypothetical protein